jgi:hypothetical protein
VDGYRLEDEEGDKANSEWVPLLRLTERVNTFSTNRCYTYQPKCWSGSRSRYGYSLRVGRSGVRMPVGRYFLHPPRPALEPVQPLVQWLSGLFPGIKAAGAWR